MSLVLAGGGAMGRGASYESLTTVAAAARAASEAIIGNGNEGEEEEKEEKGEEEEDEREEKEKEKDDNEEKAADLERKEGAFLPPPSSSPTKTTTAYKRSLLHNGTIHHHKRTLTKLGPNQLRLVCFGGYALVLLSMYGISPFFQKDAQSRIHMAPSLAGLVFSLSALTSMLVTPLAAHLCKFLGRFQTLFLGYLTSLTANAGFSFSTSTAYMTVFRGFQGVAMGLVAVASMTLLIAGSDNIVRDMGLQEMTISLILIVAPILGGTFYAYLPGAEWAYLAMSAPLVVVVICLAVFLGERQRKQRQELQQELQQQLQQRQQQRQQRARLPLRAMGEGEGEVGKKEWGDEARGTTATSSFSTLPSGVDLNEEIKEGDREGGREGGVPRVDNGGKDEKDLLEQRQQEPLRVWSNPRVILIALAITLTFAAQGFLALSFGIHTRNLLSLSAAGAGAMYIAFSLPYALMGLVIGPLSRRFPSSSLLAHGALLEAVGLLLLGPPPALPPSPGPSSSSSSSSSSFSPSLLPWAWVLTVGGMLCLGVGMGLITMPAIDAMRTALLGPPSFPPSLPPSSSPSPISSGMRLEEKREERDGPEGLDEALASVMSFSLSLGAFLGPMVGGLGIQVLPHTREFNCSVRGRRKGWEDGGEDDCVSGYRWTCLVLSIVCLVVWVLLVWSARRDRVREREREGSEGWRRRRWEVEMVEEGKVRKSEEGEEKMSGNERKEPIYVQKLGTMMWSPSTNELEGRLHLGGEGRQGEGEDEKEEWKEGGGWEGEEMWEEGEGRLPRAPQFHVLEF
ncbi:permease (major facilitator superfamily) [Nannochloropsis oceanica]